MANIVNNVTKCYTCGSYVQYDPSDIETEEMSYGVGTYQGETYMGKTVKCPKCGRKIEI